MAVAQRVSDLVAQVRALPIEADYVRDLIERLTAIGSSELGFRTTGTPEDAATAALVADEMRVIGLRDVALEDVTVDAWRFRSAEVRCEGLTVRGSSLGGTPATPGEGLTADLVDVRDGKRSRLDRLQLDGRIALLDWTSRSVHPSVVVLELARRGVRGVIVWCSPGGAWFQHDEALGAFDAQWPADMPPMTMVSRADGARLRSTTGPVTLRVQVETTRAATGHNVVGYLPGAEPGPIVIGAHHDAWFRGAFDNSSGVAVMLALAKALVADGYRPRHTLCFTSRTGEEFGKLDAQDDWCIGAWEQVATTHPQWSREAPFHLCLEASGHRVLRTIVEAPVEYRAWARSVCQVADAEGWTPTGWRVAPPVTGTEQWPYLLQGVPGVAAYAWDASFADTEYHTQLDTPATVDCDIAAAQARLYALLLLDADRRPDEIVDHVPRARELARIAERSGHRALAEAAQQHRTARGRAAFSAVGRELHAVDAEGAAAYPHAQALRDVEALDAALAALGVGERRAAARHVRRVGSNRLHTYLSQPALQTYLDQFAPHAAASWGAACHLTPSPNLWDAIDDLTARDGDDAAVRTTLARARDTAARELAERLGAMALALHDNEKASVTSA